MPDITIIGAGHNGLVCACYLARAGHRVTVLEQAPIPGGCTTTEEKYPGFHYNIGAIELEGMVHSGIIEELGLSRFGLEMIRSDHLLSAWVGKEALHLVRDLETSLGIIEAEFGPQAAREWKTFADYSEGLMSALGAFQHVKAPDAGGAGSVFAKLGAIGSANEELIQNMVAPSISVIDAFLTHPHLKAAALAYGTHPQLPPWLPGTGPLASLLPSSHGGQGARPKGGTGKLIEALIACLEAHGGEVRCNAGVSRLLLKDRRVTGVLLKDGTELPTTEVVSTVDLKRVMRMSDSEAFPASMHKAARKAHCGLYNVGEVKLDIALESAPEFLNDDPRLSGALKYLMPSADSYDRTFREIMGGRLPENPPLMVGVPSIDDPSMCPEGKAVLWVSSFVPAAFSDGRSWPEANEATADHILDAFEQYAPGTKGRILHCEITGPHEWEVRTGNPAGNPNHIDMTIDQCFSFRPGIDLDHYRTPIEGLYLSGAGTHPGGGVHGMPGKLAAEAILDGDGAKKKASGPSIIGLVKSYFQLRKALR